MGQGTESLTISYQQESYVSENWWQHARVLWWLHYPLRIMAVIWSCSIIDVKKTHLQCGSPNLFWISCLGWEEFLSQRYWFSSWTVKWAWSDKLRGGYSHGAARPLLCSSCMTVAVMVTDIWLHWIWQQTQMSPWGTIPTGLFAVPKERRNLNGGPFDSHAEISSALKTENALFTQGKFLSWWYKLYASSDHIILSRRMESFRLYLQLFN